MPEPVSHRGQTAPGRRRRRARAKRGSEAVLNEVALKTKLAAQMAFLARFVPVDDFPTVVPRLGSWPGWMDAVAADLVLLCPLDPLAALRGLNALDDMVATLDHVFHNIDAILARQDALSALYPVFQAALAEGEPAQVAERAFALLTESGLLNEDDRVPEVLLEALGPEGRETLVLRLCDPQPTAALRCHVGSREITQVLLAGRDIENALDLIARFGIERHACAHSIVEALLSECEPGPELVTWMPRAVRSAFEDDTSATDALLARCLGRCEAAGCPDLVQEIRWAVFLVALAPQRLGDWLDHVPVERRAAEQARALHHVARHDERTHALRFLLEWPDLRAAARLVIEHHEAMTGADCAFFNRAAGLLEDTASAAAMLLYRQGALCRFSTGIGLVDQAPRIARCAELWARHPDGPYESHARFLDRLSREHRSRQ